jgi:hypothetical protein
MDSQIDLVIKQSVLQFLYEESYPARSMKGYSAVSIPTRPHFNDLETDVDVVTLQ